MALQERLGDVDAAAKSFAEAAETATDDKTLRAAAEFFSRHGRWEQAAAAHQSLLDANERDVQALAGLVVATSQYDPELANQHYARCAAARTNPPPPTPCSLCA